MGLFDRTATKLANGPTVVVAGDPGDPGDLLHRYAPDAWPRGDRLVIGNGVLLYGPVEVTPDLAAKTGLPVGNAYYTSAGVQRKGEDRPTEAKELDGEWLVRALAARLPGTKHSKRPWAEAKLELSVYAEQPAPPEQTIPVLQPFVGTEPDQALEVVDRDTPESPYFIVCEAPPPFITAFWPGRLARLDVAPPPTALGELRRRKPCRWQLITTHDAATVDLATCHSMGETALALASAVGGVVTDQFGFPITRPDDVLPG